MRKFTAILLFSFLFFACSGTNGGGGSGDKASETKNDVSVSPRSVRVSATNADSAEPAIAVDKDGGIYLVWVEHSENKSSDVFLEKFNSELKPVGEPVRVNPQAGQATAWRGDQPTVAIGANNEIYVGWTARVKTETANGTDLFVSVSRDGGKTFGAPVKVNDDAKPASHGMHSLATDKSGKIYVAWLDERNIKLPSHARLRETKRLEEFPEFQYNKAHHTPTPEVAQAPKTAEAEPNSEIFFAVSIDGGKTFSPNKKISSEVCPCCKTSLAVSPDDKKIYASWRQVLDGNFRHIAVASSEDGGDSFSKPAIVNDDQWQIAACPVSGASLSVKPDNSLEVLWFSGGRAGSPGLYRAESIDGGKTFSPRAAVSEGMISGTSVLLSNSEKVWEADGKLFRSKATGERQQIGDGSLPSAALLPGGKLIVGFVKKDGEKRGVWLSVSDE